MCADRAWQSPYEQHHDDQRMRFRKHAESLRWFVVPLLLIEFREDGGRKMG